ncbi:SIR2 family NAD-dependent protein deacylase [Clostridium felsineum]|uniref:Protein ADP-ribosyltransferase n=1 Tax=Clostridium felsineum TaxID=36839 RepID=A0A1S8LMM1_9CLOT|nr:hypothetical protein [Clostridium felsineum]URZ05190.1 Protein ADP-ribosyltransferase [Clostridium felsineum]URZ10231.1 Protein ADP-ribosyltransferase [Clostridium felsineum]
MLSELYKEKLYTISQKINEAEVIIVGGASGMSTAAGYNWYKTDENFLKYFSGFAEKYNIDNIFNGFYYRFSTKEERWAYITTLIKFVYDSKVGKPYMDLLQLLKDKEYFIVTTNQDTQFLKIFPEGKVAAIQGDLRYFQCSQPCHDKVYFNKEQIEKMYGSIKETRMPTKLIPICPKCGKDLEPWVRSFQFLEGSLYKSELNKYREYLRKSINKKVLFLELGVGTMTPMFIKEPFWRMTYSWKDASYISINPKDAVIPLEIEKKGLAVNEDIAKVLHDLVLNI